jgi:hypothetical protein
MANRDFSGFQAFTQRMVEVSSGVWARVFAVYQLDASGNPVASPALGRAAAAASYPSVLSNEDKTALDKAPGTYRRAATVSASAGDGILVTGVTTAGTVTLTLGGGGSVSVSVPLGSSVLPFGCTAAALGTAVGGTFQSLFFA